MNGINDTINHISDMYKFFNEKFEAKLPDDVVFTLIPNKSTRGRYLGWFFRSRWNNNGVILHEINLTPDFLNRTTDEVAETIIHEITHLKNFTEKITDCNKQQYHNKHFKTRAESFGLKVERMKGKGYALTSLGERAKSIVEEYKTTILKGTNPFTIHRIPVETVPSKPKDTVSVAIKINLAEVVSNLSGEKLGTAVKNILKEWVDKQAQEAV